MLAVVLYLGRDSCEQKHFRTLQSPIQSVIFSAKISCVFCLWLCRSC
jgi:hypothetical protein